MAHSMGCSFARWSPAAKKLELVSGALENPIVFSESKSPWDVDNRSSTFARKNEIHSPFGPYTEGSSTGDGSRLTGRSIPTTRRLRQPCGRGSIRWFRVNGKNALLNFEKTGSVLSTGILNDVPSDVDATTV